MKLEKLLNFIQKTKILSVFIYILLSIALLGSSIKIGVVSDSNRELVNLIKKNNPKLKIELINYQNNEDLNKDLIEKKIDINLFQTLDGIAKYKKQRGRFDEIGVARKTYIDTIGVYSKKNQTIKDIKVGATIVIPADPSNRERSLVLLQKIGLLKLNIKKNKDLTQEDIVENPFDIQILEVKKNLLPRYLSVVDYTLMTGDLASEQGYIPIKDSLFLEEFNPKYVNVVVVRNDSMDSNKIKDFLQEISSQEVKLFILKKYGDNILFDK